MIQCEEKFRELLGYFDIPAMQRLLDACRNGRAVRGIYRDIGGKGCLLVHLTSSDQATVEELDNLGVPSALWHRVMTDWDQGILSRVRVMMILSTVIQDRVSQFTVEEPCPIRVEATPQRKETLAPANEEYVLV